MAAFVSRSYTSISEMVSKSSQPTFLKTWLCNWCSCHWLLSSGLHWISKKYEKLNENESQIYFK